MRLRFAPSPTGALHIGGARTALFNWLLARGSGGTLVLRIEDTDRERSTPENVAQILDALRWLELDWDEGPIMQSARAARHAEALQALLAAGIAYRSTATAEDVKAYKHATAPSGVPRAGAGGHQQEEGAVRLRVPDEGATVVHDVIRGETRFEHVHLDDPVIARADGSVLYNFAVAIDDLDAAITHVVRGEDHLSNTPKQLLVLEAARAAGIAPDAALPVYAHLPLLHGPDGKKLSKRHGAASVQELRAPASCRRRCATTWRCSAGAPARRDGALDRGAVERFALERVSRNPAQFDEAKLRWMNGVYIRKLAPAELARRLRRTPSARVSTQAWRRRRGSARRRSRRSPTSGRSPGSSSNAARPMRSAAARWLDERGRHTLAETRAALAVAASFDEAGVKRALGDVQQRLACKPREVYQPLRVAVGGTTVSPGNLRDPRAARPRGDAWRVSTPRLRAGVRASTLGRWPIRLKSRTAVDY